MVNFNEYQVLLLFASNELIKSWMRKKEESYKGRSLGGIQKK